jgi:TrmH family RNA methyltransferase
VLSGNQTKFIKSLQLKKFRLQEQAFLVEGGKCMEELLRENWEVTHIYITENYFNGLPFDLQKKVTVIGYDVVTPTQLEKVGTLKSNNAGLLIAKMQESISQSLDISQPILMLDDINDPGNLGTILRIADWYNIPQVVCSPTSADFYNPKTISASKGSFARIKVRYTDLTPLIDELKPTHVFGAVLDGENLHKIEMPQNSTIIIGNETHGINLELLKKITNPITIPRFGSAESLNAGIATGIILDHYRRANS